jgi:hypothetical protein
LMINEDINIISFIRDIVFENFQMREKMVWYVESPIVLNAYYWHWFKYMYMYYVLLFAKLGRNITMYNRSYLPLCNGWNLGRAQ